MRKSKKRVFFQKRNYGYIYNIIIQNNITLITNDNKQLQEKINTLDSDINDKSIDIQILREVINKRDEELETLRDKRGNGLRVSNSAMFHINTKQDKVPRCSEDCIIF